MIRVIVASLALAVLAACTQLLPSEVVLKAPCRATVRWFSHPDPITGLTVVDSIVTTTDPAACPNR